MRHQSRSRALATSALAASLGLAGLTLAASPATAAPASTDRVAGADRYGTAADIATEAYPAADTVVLTTGEKLPDALSANPIAGAQDAPILLTLSDSIPASTQAALDGIDPADVVIVGGAAAVSDAVATQLEEDGRNVTREAGDDRFATAAEVATAVGEAPAVDADGDGAGTAVPTVAVANGLTGMPDAVAASPMLHRLSIPLLLTGPDTLNEDAAAAIEALGAEQALVLGGTTAVSGAIEDDLESDGVDVERLAGTDRWGTAAAIADFEIDVLGLQPGTTHIASGHSVADALAGGPLASVSNSPILLVSATDVPAATEQWLQQRAADIDEVIALGGTAVISDAVLADAAELADEGAARVTVSATNDDTSIPAGQPFTGVLTAEGEDITNVAVSGSCVTADSDLDETGTAGGEEFGFSVPIESDAETGSCTITFTVTLAGEDDPVTVTQPITVEPAAGGGGTPPPADPGPTRVVSLDSGDEFETIQEAVDAEDTDDEGGVDTLRAYSAVDDPFDELVIISKSGLTIEGSGGDDGRAELHGTFVITGAGGVTIEGFDISSFEPYQNASAAFYLDGVTNLVLTDNVVTGGGPTTDAKGVLNVTGGATEQAEITGNTFTGLMQGVFANDSAIYTIEGNTFEGNGVGSANDAPSEITGNVFTGNTMEGIGLGETETPSTVEGNTFNAVASGSYVCDHTADAYNLTTMAQDNTFTVGYSIEENNDARDCITPVAT